MTEARDPQDKLDIRCADAIELVTEYLDKALDEGDLIRFEAHLAHCEGCSVFVLQIQMTVRISRQSLNQQPESMPANFDELAAKLRSRN